MSTSKYRASEIKVLSIYDHKNSQGFFVPVVENLNKTKYKNIFTDQVFEYTGKALAQEKYANLLLDADLNPKENSVTVQNLDTLLWCSTGKLPEGANLKERVIHQYYQKKLALNIKKFQGSKLLGEFFDEKNVESALLTIAKDRSLMAKITNRTNIKALIENEQENRRKDNNLEF